MIKIYIKNRKGQKVCVLVEEVEQSKGLGFVMHGLSGNKDESHIKAFAEALVENGYTAVRFDTTNTFGESEGSYADATVTASLEDLEDVIAWAKEQNWYREPFILVGHSMGGMSVLLYAQKYPQEVKALAPISTVISAELSLKTTIYAQWREMKERGWINEKDGVRLKWNHMEDRLKYSVLDAVEKITMPVLLMVGSLDEGTPEQHQRILFDALSGKKDLRVIEGAGHTFFEPEHIRLAKGILSDWISRMDV